MKKTDAPLDPARMAALLRDHVLALTPEDIGLTAANWPSSQALACSTSHSMVWGVVMELAEAGVVVSLVVLLDGSVSVYLSDGSGVIGCGLHPDVRATAAKMLQVAGQVAPECKPATEHPMPLNHQVRFHLLTTQGVLGAVANRAELDEGAEVLAELYYAGHGVIGMVELLGAGVDLVDEMRLAETVTRRVSDADIDTRIGAQELKPRERGCRILPYASIAARRSRN
jgi:hypothetical protein